MDNVIFCISLNINVEYSPKLTKPFATKHGKITPKYQTNNSYCPEKRKSHRFKKALIAGEYKIKNNAF
jgi:hypothetical protein